MAAVPPQPPNPHYNLNPHQNWEPNYNQTIVFQLLFEARNAIAVRGQQLSIHPRISNGYYQFYQRELGDAVRSLNPNAPTDIIKNIGARLLDQVLNEMRRQGNLVA